MNKPPILSIMLIDDEAPARARLRDLLADINAELPNVVLVEAENGCQAIDALAEFKPDVLLLDIQMPKMNGIELARHLAQLESPPALIFVSAFDHYAVQAFELNAIDYLLKPVRAQRLATALQKIRLNPPPSAQVLAKLPQDARTHFSYHERGRLLLIPLADVLYLKADLKYVGARTVAREYLLNESLASLEIEFATDFIRLHRSVLVAKKALIGFEKSSEANAETQWQALVRGVPEKLPISRRQWPQVKHLG